MAEGWRVKWRMDAERRRAGGMKMGGWAPEAEIRGLTFTLFFFFSLRGSYVCRFFHHICGSSFTFVLIPAVLVFNL